MTLGYSDSVASIGGAIAIALHPETVNEEWFEVVNLVNDHNLLALAKALAEMRPPIGCPGVFTSGPTCGCVAG